MLRQAIIASKTANAIAVANTVMIVANERTYITLYSNVRNMLFPSAAKMGLLPVVVPWNIAPAFLAIPQVETSFFSTRMGLVRSHRVTVQRKRASAMVPSSLHFRTMAGPPHATGSKEQMF